MQIVHAHTYTYTAGQIALHSCSQLEKLFSLNSRPSENTGPNHKLWTIINITSGWVYRAIVLLPVNHLCMWPWRWQWKKKNSLQPYLTYIYRNATSLCVRFIYVNYVSQAHKFVLHKFLSYHTLQCIKC